VSTSFVKTWLPISIALHVLLLFLCNIAGMGVPKLPGETRYLAVEMVETKTPPKKPAPAVTPPVVTPPPKPKPDPVRPKPSTNPGTQVIDPRVQTGTSKKPGAGKASTDPGPKIGPVAPPAVISSPNGSGFDAPPGVPGGTGRQGTELEGGPSEEASSGYGSGNIGKNDQDRIGNVTSSATFTVQLDAGAKVTGVTKTAGDMQAEAVTVAQQKLRAHTYKPKLVNGKAVAGSVRMRVTFEGSTYKIQPL